jgi:hypothetical protein
VSYFDSYVHVYTANIDPVEFIQATGRVRAYRAREGEVFISPHATFGPDTMVRYAQATGTIHDVLDGGFTMSPSIQMEVFLKARGHALRGASAKYIIMQLTALGHSLSFGSRLESTCNAEENRMRPVDRINADTVFGVQLTQEAVEQCLEFKEDEFAFKETLSTVDFDLLCAKNRIRETLDMSVDEINLLGRTPPEGTKGTGALLFGMMLGDDKRRVKSFIHRHEKVYRGLSFSRKERVLWWLKNPNAVTLPQAILDDKVDLDAYQKRQIKAKTGVVDGIDRADARQAVTASGSSVTIQSIGLELTRITKRFVAGVKEAGGSADADSPLVKEFHARISANKELCKFVGLRPERIKDYKAVMKVLEHQGITATAETIVTGSRADGADTRATTHVIRVLG